MLFPLFQQLRAAFLYPFPLVLVFEIKSHAIEDGHFNEFLLR